MTVYELIQVLAQYPPEAEVAFVGTTKSDTFSCGNFEITAPGKLVDLVFREAVHSSPSPVIIRLMEEG